MFDSTVVPGKYDFTLYVGSDLKLHFNWSVEIESETPYEDMEPIDLTGTELFMDIRREHGDRNVLVSASTKNNRITTEPLEGDIFISIPGSASEHIPPSLKRGVYDLKIIFPNQTVVRLVEGVVRFSPKVTKRD